MHASIFLFLAVLFAVGPAAAQVSAGGAPPSFSIPLDDQVPTIVMPAVDEEALLAEDESEGKDQPLRFGYPFEVEYDMNDVGRWEELPGGARLWRLRIQSPGARSINLVYDRYRLPPGAELFLYNDDRSMLIGAFTEFNNKEDGVFATQPVTGETLTLEYHEPAGVSYAGEIRLGRVIHAYRDIFAPGASRDYGDSGSCNNNVMCPEGDPWQVEIRSVAMILTSGGSRICSGVLVNNVRHDMTQYFLTADHCGVGTGSWIFMFNYQSPGCSNQNGPTTDTVQGAQFRAGNSASDFTLVELTETIPEEYEVAFSGWSAVDTPHSSSVGIHHPSGDIKKISFDYDPAISDYYLGGGGVADSHWKVSNWEDGTTEPGSSGSPLYDPQHRVVGQLHGGYASCTSITPDWYGKFAMSWDYGGGPSSRLMDWLDPDDTGTLLLDALDPLNTMGLAFVEYEVLSDDDGDGVPEPGELVELAVSLEYTGDTPLDGVSALLQEQSEWLNVETGSSAYPLFNPGETHVNISPFEILVHEGAPAVFEATLALELTAGEQNSTVAFVFQVGQRAVYWTVDCEGDLSGWSHSGTGDWGDDWHLSTEDSQSPVHAWKCGDTGTGDYANHLDSRLVSPQVELLPFSLLRLMHRMNAEVSGAFPDSAYDGGVVELSVDGGQSWMQLSAVSGAYNKAFRWESGGGNPATHPLDGGTPCYSGGFGWQEAVFDLEGYSGQTVSFRFRFGSDNGGGDEGWYVDDLVLEGLESGGPDPVTDLAIDYIGGSQVLLEWSASAGASSYRVETASVLGGAWSTLGTTTDTSWTENTVTGSMLFRVVAVE